MAIFFAFINVAEGIGFFHDSVLYKQVVEVKNERKKIVILLRIVNNSL